MTLADRQSVIYFFITNTGLITAQKMKFSNKNFFSKCGQIQFPADLVTFTEETLNGKLHFFMQLILFTTMAAQNRRPIDSVEAEP